MTPEEFQESLKDAARTVESWPQWKKDASRYKTYDARLTERQGNRLQIGSTLVQIQQRAPNIMTESYFANIHVYDEHNNQTVERFQFYLSEEVPRHIPIVMNDEKYGQLTVYYQNEKYHLGTGVLEVEYTANVRPSGMPKSKPPLVTM